MPSTSQLKIPHRLTIVFFLVITAFSSRILAEDNLLKYLLKQNNDAPQSLTFSMDFSHDGNQFAAVGLDKVVRIWDVTYLAESQNLNPPKKIHLFDGTGSVGWLYSVKFSPDDALIGVGTNLGGFLISTTTGEIVSHLAFPEGGGRMEAFHGMAFSPDGRWLATGHTKKVRFWNLQPVWDELSDNEIVSQSDSQGLSERLLEQVITIPAHEDGKGGHIYTLEFSAPSKQGELEMVSATGDTEPVAWRIDSGIWERLYTLPSQAASFTASYLTEGHQIVTASENQTVTLFQDGRLREKLLQADSDIFRQPMVRALSDGKHILLGNWPKTTQCLVYNVPEGREVSRFLLHDDLVSAIACHPAKNVVATAGSSKSCICFWNPTTGKMISSIESDTTSIQSVAFSADGRTLAFGTTYLNAYQLEGARRTAFRGAHNETDYEFIWGLFRGAKYTTPLESAFDLEQLNPDTETEFAEADLEQRIWQRELLSLDGWSVDRYSSRDDDDPNKNENQIVVMRNGEEVSRITTPNKARAEICTLTRIDRSGRIGVLLAYSGGRLALLDIETSDVIREFVGAEHDLTSLVVSPDFQYVAAGCKDHTIRIWSLRNPGKTQRLLGVQLPVKTNRIEAVVGDSPAARAGLRAGDEIISLNATPIANIADLVSALQSEAGEVSVVYRRNGTSFSVDIRPISKNIADIKVPLLTLLLTDRGRWVAWTEEGFYTCSPGADDLFGWQVNHGLGALAEFLPAERFKAALNRPDLVQSVLKSHGDPNAVPERLTINQLLASSRPPIVRFVNPQQNAEIPTKEFAIKAKIQHVPELPIQSIQMTVNGQLTRVLTVMPTLEAGGHYEETVSLSRGVNNISIQAFGPGGISSEPDLVAVNCTATDAPGLSDGELPNLYLIAVGVSKHQNANLNLMYAAKDAKDITSVLTAQKGRHFAEIQSTLLTDEQATSANVESALKQLRAIRPREHDFVIIFVSGHGTQDADGEYRFVTTDFDPENLESSTIGWDAFEKALRRHKANNFLILDTCHAGAAVGSNTVGEESSHAYNKILDRAVSNAAGMITFASCLPHEKSLEDPAWQNGAFTKAIVEGLGGPADTDNDHIISISELETYVSQRVAALSNRRQNTALFKSTSVASSLAVALP